MGRRQFVELDTFKSYVRKAPNCSVVQGGKLSGLLYNTYINELPMIHKLLNDRDICNVNTNVTKNTSHVTIQFIDDSTNIISFKNDNIIKPYLEEYYKLLYDYYTANKLKINPDKTQYVIICKN